MNKENLYITYTPDEIKIFLSLAPHSNQTYTATSQLLKVAKRISIFKDIPDSVLIKIVKNVKIIKYHNGEIVIKEKEVTKSMFYILLGEVEVIKHNKIIATLNKQTIFGEIASLLNQPRSATIIASKENTTIIEFEIDFNLMKGELGYYFAIIYKNLAIELAKKLL
jgi:CRP-like cAMP-binding protein